MCHSKDILETEREGIMIYFNWLLACQPCYNEKKEDYPSIPIWIGETVYLNGNTTFTGIPIDKEIPIEVLNINMSKL